MVLSLKYTRLGRKGPRISVVGLGFWEMGGRAWSGESPGNFISVVEKAVEMNINFFDTAEIYGLGDSERKLGKAIKHVKASDEVVIASKVAGFRFYRGIIKRGVEGINRRLGRTVDLIQTHWPPPLWIPICKVIRGLENAVKEGLAHYYGLSNYPADLVEKALYCSKRIEPLSDQVQYNLVYRTAENKLKPLLERRGLSLIAWSPLAKGSLAGLRSPKDPAQRQDPVFKVASSDEKLQGLLERISEDTGLSKAVISLSWLISKGAIPIPGTRRPERVVEVAKAGDLDLPEEIVRKLDDATKRYLTRWGKTYRALYWLRFVPCGIQYLAIVAGKGV